MSHDVFAYLLIFYCLKTNGDRVGVLQKNYPNLENIHVLQRKHGLVLV